MLMLENYRAVCSNEVYDIVNLIHDLSNRVFDFTSFMTEIVLSELDEPKYCLEFGHRVKIFRLILRVIYIQPTPKVLLSSG